MSTHLHSECDLIKFFASAQKLLECLSPQSPEALLASAERREAVLLQQLRETAAKVDGLAGKVCQCHLDEREAWDQWLSRQAPEASDLRQVCMIYFDTHPHTWEDL